MGTGAFLACTLTQGVMTHHVQEPKFTITFFYVFQIMVIELIACWFFLVINFFFKDEDTCYFGKENAHNYQSKLFGQLALAIAYFVSINMAYHKTYSYLNPAIDFAIIFTNVYYNNAKPLTM